MCAGEFSETIYINLQFVIPYIEAPCMAILKNDLDIDSSPGQNILRKVGNEALYKC